MADLCDFCCNIMHILRIDRLYERIIYQTDPALSFQIGGAWTCSIFASVWSLILGKNLVMIYSLIDLFLFILKTWIVAVKIKSIFWHFRLPLFPKMSERRFLWSKWAAMKRIIGGTVENVAISEKNINKIIHCYGMYFFLFFFFFFFFFFEVERPELN